jgi:histidine ammonia-lyase
MISSSRQPLVLEPGLMTLEQLKLIHQHQQFIALPDSCRPDIRKSQALVEACANGDAPVYGVNTGFGKLATNESTKSNCTPYS